MHDPIAVPLKRRADIVLSFGAQAPSRVRALCRLRREDLGLSRLELFAKRHTPPDGATPSPQSPHRYFNL